MAAHHGVSSAGTGLPWPGVHGAPGRRCCRAPLVPHPWQACTVLARGVLIKTPSVLPQGAEAQLSPGAGTSSRSESGPSLVGMGKGLGVISQVPFEGKTEDAQGIWRGFGFSPQDSAAAQRDAQQCTVHMLCAACMYGVHQYNGTGQELSFPSILFGLWAAGLGPSGAVATGQSTTNDPAIHLDADTQARCVVLDLTQSHVSTAPPFLVRLLLSNASFNREIQLSGCFRLFLALAVKKLKKKKKKKDVSLPRNVSSCLRAAQGAPAGTRTGTWRVESHL